MSVFIQPTRYTVSIFPPEHQGHIDADLFEIQVERTGPGRWAVRRNGRCLNADGHWDYESIPSERTDEWLALYRHSLEDALRLADVEAPLIRTNGKTATEMLAWVLLDAALEPVLREDGESG